MIQVEIVTEATPEVVAAVGDMLPLLSSSAPRPTPAEVEEIVNSPCTRLFVAREEGSGRLLGTLTLAVFRIPTGVRAWIEDVIVAEEARGQGVGEMLSRAALETAAEAGAKTVELTSRPARQAANRLYHRMGFEPRDTNVYRYNLGT